MSDLRQANALTVACVGIAGGVMGLVRRAGMLRLDAMVMDVEGTTAA